jgi:hypothetical protein
MPLTLSHLEKSLIKTIQAVCTTSQPHAYLVIVQKHPQNSLTTEPKESSAIASNLSGTNPFNAFKVDLPAVQLDNYQVCISSLVKDQRCHLIQVVDR